MGRWIGIVLGVAIASVALASFAHGAPDAAGSGSSWKAIIVTRSEISYTFDLPRRGATDVPLNAKQWRIGPRLTDVESKPFVGSLPNARFVSDGWSFQTSAVRDDTPPSTPNVGARVLVESTDDNQAGRQPGRQPVTAIEIDGRLDDDVVLLRIDLEDRLGVQTIWVDPRGPTATSDFKLARDDTTATVRAVDVAGNESAAAPMPIFYELRLPGFVVTPDARDSELVTVFGIVLAILGVVAFFRRIRVVEIIGEPISPIIAESVARNVRRVAVIGFATSLPTVIWWASFDRMGAYMLSTVPIWFLGKLYLAGAALRHLEHGATTVERRRDSLYVASRHGRVHVGASSGAFAAAERVPIASATTHASRSGDNKP